MKDLFVNYFHELTDCVPVPVYEALLSVFLIAVVLIIAFAGIKKGWKKIAKLLLYEYLFLLSCSTVIFRNSNGVRGYELAPLWSYRTIAEGTATMIPEVVMNVVVFVPIGLLMGLIYNEEKWWRVIMAGVGVSFTIELLQLLSKNGCCETDDIIHNTVGCVIGYGAYCVARITKDKVAARKG